MVTPTVHKQDVGRVLIVRNGMESSVGSVGWPPGICTGVPGACLIVSCLLPEAAVALPQHVKAVG